MQEERLSELTKTIEEEVNLTIKNIQRYAKELKEILHIKTPLELPKNENDSLKILDQKTLDEAQEKMVKQIKKNLKAEFPGPRISFREYLKNRGHALQEKEEGHQDNKGAS